MKYLLLPLSALLLTSCATAMIKKTYTASTVPDPKAIYIRYFDLDGTKFIGDHGLGAERAVARERSPVELALAMKQELSKLAPAMVIAQDEAPAEGWIVEGNIDIVDGGSRIARGVIGVIGAGRSTIKVHVRVVDAATGTDLFAFDISGGSGLTGPLGNTGASGLGVSREFDYKNVASETLRVLSLDPSKHGLRTAP